MRSGVSTALPTQALAPPNSNISSTCWSPALPPSIPPSLHPTYPAPLLSLLPLAILCTSPLSDNLTHDRRHIQASQAWRLLEGSLRSAIPRRSQPPRSCEHARQDRYGRLCLPCNGNLTRTPQFKTHSSREAHHLVRGDYPHPTLSSTTSRTWNQPAVLEGAVL
jgi:hypothetical protein